MTARSELGTLEASGLIEIAALQPELEYLFRHALIQEAAYGSLLKQDRRALHRAAAETILLLHPERERELAGVVGMHLELAGDSQRAAQHLVVAGEHALERFASKEASAFFNRACALADKTDVDLRLRAAIGAAKAGWSNEPAEVGIDRLETALSGADGGQPRLVAEAYFWVAFLRRQRGEVPESSPALETALERASRLGAEVNDPRAAALPKALMGVHGAFSGQLREGARQMREALDVLESTADSLSMAMVFNFLGLTYARLGEFEAAEETIAFAHRYAAEGDEIARLDVDIVTSAINLERGELDQAAERALKCGLRSEELGANACTVVANVMYGAASLARNDAGAARAPLERSDELSRLTGQAPMRTLVKSFLGSVRAQLGDLPGGIVAWDEALANARGMGDRYGEATTLWGRGRAYAHLPAPEPDAALRDLDRAIELFEVMEARPSLARALHERAEVLRALARDEEAEASARRSRELSGELGLRDLQAA
jgi:tetratricopeptide (TPR) repeat protein